MKKIIIITLMLVSVTLASSQSKLNDNQGVILNVEEVNDHLYRGDLIDLETQKVVSFISHRPVEISELVIYILIASKPSDEEEAKAFSQLIR